MESSINFLSESIVKFEEELNVTLTTIKPNRNELNDLLNKNRFLKEEVDYLESKINLQRLDPLIDNFEAIKKKVKYTKHLYTLSNKLHIARVKLISNYLGVGSNFNN